MRDVIKPARAPHSPKGLAFAIADLVLAKNWADHHDFRMVVRLDHGAETAEDYEEVIAFQAGDSPLCRLIIWRDAANVFVQPLIGRETRYGSVTDALGSLPPKQALQRSTQR